MLKHHYRHFLNNAKISLVIEKLLNVSYTYAISILNEGKFYNYCHVLFKKSIQYTIEVQKNYMPKFCSILSDCSRSNDRIFITTLRRCLKGSTSVVIIHADWTIWLAFETEQLPDCVRTSC